MTYRVGNFDLLKQIGFGSKSNVFLCEKDSIKYAIKIFDSSWIDYLSEEISIHWDLDHPNVVKMVDFGLNADQI